MALYNTVSVPCQQSCWPLQEIRDITLNTTEVLTVGMCWWDGKQCFEILSLNGAVLDPIVPTAVYNNCDECFSQNQLGAFISPCSGGLRETFWLPGYAICEGATYEFNGVCFQTGRIEPYLPGKQEPITFPEQPTLIGQESCLLCLQSGYTYVYLVVDCLTSETHIVGSDISYSCLKTGGIYSYVLESDPTTQRCGQLKCLELIDPIVEGFITGFIGFDENSCDVCLEQANKKVEVINCIDQSVEVVWASTFFNIGDITFIDFVVPGDKAGDTQIRCCYSIGEETEGLVTIPTILSYSVSPSCPECIECNGVYYLWEDCNNSEITGSSLSYQYMTVGQTFVSPSNDGSCKRVIGASTNLPTDLLAGSLVNNEFTIQSNQFNDRVRFFFEQPDGKFLIGGHFTSFGLNTTNKIVRLNSDGTYDNTFVGGFGPSISNNAVINIDQQSDGKILVAGNFTSFDNGITTNTNNYICRLNTDGTFDTTFLPVLNNTGFDNGTQCVEVQNDGKILVGGWFDNYDDGSGPVLANRLIRLNSDGSVDPTFNTGTGFINNVEGDNGRVFQTKTQLDGKIIVVGQFDEYNGLPAKGIIRLNSDGSRDTTFNMGTGFDGNPLDGYGYYLARWINLYPDGKMLISGHFEYYDGQPANKLIRLNSDGSVDTTFTSLGFGPSYFDDRAIQTQIQPDGKIIVGGFFETYDSQSYEKLIRLNSDGTIDTSFYVGSGFNDYVLATYITSDYRLLVGGQFTAYKTFTQNFITELNLTPQIDTIYSSPIFTDCPNCVEQTTSLLAGRIFPSEMNGGIDDIALSMREQPDGKILIGGWFNDYNGDNVNSIFRLNSDGTLDPTFQNVGLLNDAAYGIDLQSDGKILVGGWFNQYDNQQITNGFARLNTDGTLDTTFLANTGFTVNSQQYANNVIKVLPDDKILVGGGFVNYNNMDYRGVMKFNQDGSVDTTFNVSGTGVYNDFNPSNIYQDYALNMAGTFQCSAPDINKRFVSTGDEIFVSTSGTPLTISESFKIPTSISQLIYSKNISLLVGWNQDTVIVIDPVTYSVVSNQTYSNVNFTNGITNDSNYLYLYNGNVGGVYVIDILSNTLVTTISTPYVQDMSYNDINNRVYFTTYDSNVYYIDTLTNTLTTINVGNGPYNYITIDTVNNKLYLPRVFNVPGFPRQVVVVDCVTETISTIIPLPNSSYGDLVFDKDNGVVYVTNDDLIIIDTSTDTIIETQTNWDGNPSRLFYDVDEKMLFSTNNREIYDPLSAKNYVSSYDFLGGRGVENTSNNFYYILKNVPYTTSYDVYMLYVINSQTGGIESVISLPERGNFIIYEPTINKIFVTTDNYLLEIDGNTNTITNSLGGTYYDLTYENGFIYAVDYTNNYLAKIDPSTYAMTNLSVGVSPVYLTKDLDNNRIYVSNGGSDDISVVDLSSFTVTNTVSVGDNPTRLIYNYNDQTIYVYNSNDANFSYINASTLIVGGTFVAVGPPVIDLLIDVNGYMFASISNQYNAYDLVSKTNVGGQGTGANYTTLFSNSSGNIMTPTTYYLIESYSFSPGRVYSFNVQSDGSILMGGYFKYYNNTISPNLIKVLSNGQIDPSFNIGTGFSGGSPLPGSVRNILRQSDGKFICTGHFTDYDGNSVNRIVRLNSDGSIDNTFNIGTGFDQRVLNSVLQSDGKIICVGEFEDYNGTSVNRIVRLNSDGSIDNTFNIGNGFDDLARTLYLLSDNTLLVSGYFGQYDNYPSSNNLVRLATEPTTSDYTWYEFLPCNGGNVGYILMDSTFNLVGDIVRANYSDNSIICGTIGEQVFEFPESGDMYTLTNQTTYGSCFECNDGIVYGVTVRKCSTGELLTFNMSPDKVINTLLFGPVFTTLSGVDCYQLIDFCVIPNESLTITPSILYNNCTNCLDPRIAGTEYTECVICCECGSTGSTVTQVVPPHPTWTDGYGKAVIQSNMVVLGGMFGLNN